MSNDNSVTIIGTATRDPEIRYTPSSHVVAKFGIARNPRRKEGNEWVDGDPQFYDVTCWGSLAENVAETVSKGQRVIVFGELDFQSWEADDGTKRNKVEIKAEAIGPDLRWATAAVTKVSKNDGGGNSGGQQARQAPPEANPFG